MSTSETTYMQRCFTLAQKGMYSARPNPAVGCLIVRDGEVAGEGWHRVYGQAHAEINALEEAGDKAGGATLFVSMEPCSHWGKTGPCCESIIAAGIKKVVYGMLDPNPVVAGRGINRLRDAGIEVQGPVLEAEAAELNPGFVKRMKYNLPFVRCKMAMSLDGRTAMASGESKWISGEEAREDVQLWRARSSAVMTSVDTVIGDDPSLNVRIGDPAIQQPLRIIVDSGLRTPVSAKILHLPGEVIIATALTKTDLIADKISEYEEAGLNVQVHSCPDTDGKVDLKALLQFLAAEKSCNEVLLESGARLAGAMLQAAVVDEMITYIAPFLLGSEARPLFNLPGISSMTDRITLQIMDVALVGKDCRMRSRVVKT